jgi:hypothetical protein
VLAGADLKTVREDVPRYDARLGLPDDAEMQKLTSAVTDRISDSEPSCPLQLASESAAAHCLVSAIRLQ